MNASHHWIQVYGITVRVTLAIDETALANQLGAKAVESRGRKAKLAHGYIVATVSAEACELVKKVKATRKAARQLILDQKAADDRQRVAEGRACVHCGTLDLRHSMECDR